MSIDLARKVAGAIGVRSETKIRAIDEALSAYARLTVPSPVTPITGSIAASQVTSGTFADARIAESNVTQHEAAINHDALTNFVSQEHIRWDLTGAEDVHADRIAEAAVTQHEAALSLTESQISDLGNYPELDQTEAITGSWSFSMPVGIGTSSPGRLLHLSVADLNALARFDALGADTGERVWLMGATHAAGEGQFRMWARNDADSSGGAFLTFRRNLQTLLEAILIADEINLQGVINNDQGVALGGGSTATLGTIGGSGPTSAGQAQWLEIEISGTRHWIPAWT